MVAKQTTSTPQPGASVRPRPATSEATQRRARTPNIMSFAQESRAELRKVTWPTGQQTMNLTIAVIGMTIAISAFLGIIDEVLNFVITPLIGGK